MTNAAMMNEEMVISTSVEMLKAMAEDKAVMAAASMDEAYEAFKKYATVTKDEFMKMVNEISPVVDDAEEDNSRRLLTDDELDMVVGGGIGSWFKKIGNKIKDTAKKAWNATPTWVKGVVIGAAVGAAAAALVVTGIGVGFAAGAAALAEAGTAAAEFGAGMAACSGAIGGFAAGGAIFGAIGGALSA